MSKNLKIESAGFPQQNCVMGPPNGGPEASPDGGDGGCNSLNVCRTVYAGTDDPVVISRWRINADVLKRISETGEIWLHIHGVGMPPVSLTVENPFTEDGR